nr:YqaE/Pmp3 family membrane protein [uncultured Flavobacterium sp.]
MLIAILFPFISFMIRGKILIGIICLALQITVIGWLPAAIWAVSSYNKEKADQRTSQIIEAINNKK